MHLAEKSFAGITEADLDWLKRNRVREDRTIEYKEALQLTSLEERKKFLIQVSAFSNTSGGHLIYGIREDKGAPVEVCGIELTDEDKMRQQMENLMRDGIEPRIQGVLIRAVPLSNGKVAVVIWIPKSWNQPHAVRYQDHWRFYARNSAGKFPLDVSELRSAFLQSETLADRIRKFRLERLTLIQSGESPIGDKPGAKAVLHIMPFESFGPAYQIDWNEVVHGDVFLPPLGATGHNSRFNLDGCLTFREDSSQKITGYSLLFRRGIVESLDTRNLEPWNGEKLIGSTCFEDDLLAALGYFVKAMPKMQVNPPFVVAYTLLGVRGYMFGVHGYRSDVRIDRDDLLIPEVVSETASPDVHQLLKPIFDSVWNAGGHPQSMSFDKNGKWVR